MAHAILTRTFDTGGGQGVTVRFFKPMADRGDWRCDYEIVWPNEKRTHRVFGIDAIQALILAMSVVQAELEAWTKANGVKLSWLGSGDLGLPRWTPRRQLILADHGKAAPRVKQGGKGARPRRA